ncbi:GHKL domain-containing protein [Dyadobacter sp. SG02]|uniref:sensor histidine kinase n=1 Tax=Dyadobacter sp. SG02 TaxID=1855291 RepID=UPI0008B0E020|nr:histidine kinase [Dyadobacter sp. SG02]SEJ61304.1 GHKL domain-containing protein [Dyadobacter sp. SG02]
MQKAVSKLYHIPFWLAYHYLWWVVAMGNPWKAAHSILFSPYAVKFVFYVVLQAVAVYFNLYYLIPKYLEKGRFKSYIGYLGITLLATALAIVSGYYVSALLAHQSVETLFGRDTNCFFYFFGEAMPSTLASTTLAMSIKLTKNWISTERRKQLLEKEKLETELRFLKYQFNPHFLFNSINSIFFLIHKNPDAASSSLAKFSELLRHHLYECNDELVPLEKEIAYLHNFIALEKLRQNRGVMVTTDIPDDFPAGTGIAPFILMTFVENAFKHISKDNDRENWIEIRLRLEMNMLAFEVSNSTSPLATRQALHYGGIGLKNVQRRLDLIYPGLHTLEIRHTDDAFHVSLRISLAPQVVASAPHLALQ